MRLAIFLSLITVVLSCNSYKAKYPYSLDDFRPKLRSELEKIVINGGMCGAFDVNSGSNGLPDMRSSFIDTNATEQELQKLIVCEHPLLRAYAFDLLGRRKSPLINVILLNHLDDTAMISYCAGEFGNMPITVADYLLEQSQGNTTLIKQDVVEIVVAKHPYLVNAAGLFVYPKIPMDKYYTELKSIILKDYPLHYNYRNQLIAKLSSHKKQIDTSLIKESLKERWRDEALKFQMIENDPTPGYFFVIEKFYKSLLVYKYQGVLEAQYQRDQNFELTFGRFINGTAAYKSKRSAIIIKSILKDNLYPNNSNSRDKLLEYNFHYSLLKTLEKYDCDFYSDIKNEIMPKAKAYESKYALPPLEPYPVSELKSDEQDPKYW